jgi:uncharacterized membrane protein YfcA
MSRARSLISSLVCDGARLEYTRMANGEFLLVCGAILFVAFLYSSVGHAGASGYIAVLSLFGYAPGVIRPVALVLNILVATIGTVQFVRAGHFNWKTFWPFGIPAVPLAFLGGYLTLPTKPFKVLVGIVLLASAAWFFYKPSADGETKAPANPVAMATGGFLGFLAGLTGTGGGVFLTPALIVLKWAKTKTASATSVVFILLNSIAGLAGNFSATKEFPTFALTFAGVAVVGGTAGSYLGSRKLDVVVVKRLLAVVLVIAGFKLVLT